MPSNSEPLVTEPHNSGTPRPKSEVIGRRYSSISGILIRDEDFSTIELGDYGNEPSMPLGEMSPAVKCRPKSIKKIKFGDELGHSLEEVHYTDNLVYHVEEEVEQTSCCIII